MKKIPLVDRRGAVLGYSTVDNADQAWLSKFQWHLLVVRGEYCYAIRREGRDLVYMHRQICGVNGGSTVVDHDDHDGLNNQRKNLKPGPASLNQGNRFKQLNPCSSIYKGVSWHKTRRKWTAQIRTKERQRHLGVFLSELEAARSYNRAAVQYFGASALLNEVPDGKG